MKVYDEKKLKLLIRAGIESNPGPHSDEEGPRHASEPAQQAPGVSLPPLPVPRRRGYGGRGGGHRSAQSVNQMGEKENFVCECGDR